MLSVITPTEGVEQTAVATLSALVPGAAAGMVRYPLAIAKGKKSVRIKGPADLIARYSEVITPCIRQTILAQRISRLFCRDQGVMFGNGEVWINEPFVPAGAGSHHSEGVTH